MSNVLYIRNLELAFRVESSSVCKYDTDTVCFTFSTLWRNRNNGEWSEWRKTNIVCFGYHRFSDLEVAIRESTLSAEEKENVLKKYDSLDYAFLAHFFDKHTDKIFIGFTPTLADSFWVNKDEIITRLEKWTNTAGFTSIGFKLDDDGLYHITFKCKNEYVLIHSGKDGLVSFNEDDYTDALVSREDAIAFIDYLIEEKREILKKDIDTFMNDFLDVDPGEELFRPYD